MKEKCLYFLCADSGQKFLPEVKSSNIFCELGSQVRELYAPLDHTVYDGLKKGKKTCSVPGDIPTKILEEFLPELTTPIAAIYRESLATHTLQEGITSPHQ